MIEDYCPVCGFKFQERSGPLRTGDMCPCCAFEFGVTDDLHRQSFSSWRKRWVDAGCPWPGARESGKPNGWDPTRQLLNIGIVLIDYNKNSTAPHPRDALKAELHARKLYRQELYQRALVESPESGLRIFAGSDGTYKVYDAKTGDFAIYESDGQIVEIVNLKAQGQTSRQINDYLKKQGTPIQSIPGAARG